jgi:alpha-amylase/alpha-mannosidase (GH57 family)
MESKAERYICIHGHFYQPPRENAWLEQVEWQDSAYPYHDWNERVTAECYLPNASSRILDGDGYITRIVSNYARMSFNFGPTLLTWLETGNAEVYRAIIEADRQSQEYYSRHGSALAQAYNHLIMPLANQRDRYSQVLWGIRDFEHRFGRRPEGMWLPETAVDLATLDVMAGLGLKFTILAPHQARRVRQTGASSWKDVSNASIDTTRAYLVNLPSGRNINVFFYDGPIASAVSFQDVLKNGDRLVARLTGAFSDRSDHPQLVHIATDGETYGHHHRFADMALAYALQHIEENNLARLTNYGEFLEKYPPTHEVEIIEKTSWSCVHGIDRWWSDCGDTTGAGDHPDWNQKWRTPLRDAFDWLRDTLAGQYEAKAGHLLKDPWAARDGYIDVILDRSPENLDRFFNEYANHPLSQDERITALKLLELQRHAMLMYTSCGWYFDELSRPEPVQVIQYAGRVVQLAEELFSDGIEESFLKILEQAKSNIPAQGDGRRIYNNMVKPAIIDLTKVAAHYAVSSLFEKYSRKNTIYCYSVENEDYNSTDCGKARLATGRSRVTSEITGESAVFSFGVFHFGDHIINAGVGGYRGEKEYRDMSQELARTCSAADFTGVIRRLDKHFGNSTYSLKSLFRDEQRKVLGYILESTMTDIENAYRQLYEHHYPPMRFLSELGGPVPRAFHSAAELIINIDLHRAINSDDLDIAAVQSLLDTAATWQVDLDAEGIGYDFKVNLEKNMTRLLASPDNIDNLEKMADMVSLARSMPFPVDLWKVQNLFWDMLQTVFIKYWREAENNDEKASAWVKTFVKLGKNLSIRVK